MNAGWTDGALDDVAAEFGAARMDALRFRRAWLQAEADKSTIGRDCENLNTALMEALRRAEAAEAQVAELTAKVDDLEGRLAKEIHNRLNPTKRTAKS